MSIFEGFEDNPEPLTPEQINKQTVDKLLARARKNDHSKFEFIRDLNEYTAAQYFKKAVTKVVESFQKSTDGLFKSYFKNVEDDVADVHLIVAAKEMDRVAKFYRDEAAIAEDMMDEYKAYLGHGHSIDAFMGVRRVEQDLYDFRKSK